MFEESAEFQATNQEENLIDFDEKRQLEIDKLKLEKKYLEKSYFERIILPAMLPTLVTAIITGTVAYLTITQTSSKILGEAKEKNLVATEKSIDAKTKYVETLLKTIEITQKRNELDSEVTLFENRKKNASDSLVIVRSQLENTKHQIDIAQKDRDIYKYQSKQYKQEVDKKSDTIKRTPILQALKTIDAILDFSYDANRLLYDDFVNALISNREGAKQLLQEYISSEKAFNNKMIIAMAAYKNLSNKEAWFTTYLHQIDSGICNTKNRKFFKTIICDQWNDDEYHKSIVYIIKYGMDTRSCKIQAYNLVNSILARKDPYLSIENDRENYLNYLTIYKEAVLKREVFAIAGVNRIINSKLISKKASKGYVCQYIIMNKDTYTDFVTQQTTDPKKLKGSEFSQISTLASNLNLTREEFLSINYWEEFYRQNKELISRLMESDFDTYKRKELQLKYDFQ